jgi:hypothetical protein
MDGERPDRGPRWLPAAAFAGAALLAAAFHLYTGFVNDDALITVRYADRLAHGLGFTYNDGERVLGTSTPLWTLVLAGASAIGLSPVATATWLGIAALGWAAAATTLLFRDRGVAWWGQALAAALVATSPTLLTWAGGGMETSAAIAALATFLWLYERGRWRALGFVGGAMLLLRPDLGLVLAAAAFLETARSRSAKALLAVLPGFAVVVVPWIAAATAYFGTPLPNSGFAKRLQVEDWGGYFRELGGVLWRVAPLLPAAAIGFAATRARVVTALPAFALVVVVAGMQLGGMPGCWWYLATPMYLVLVLATSGTVLVAERLAGGGNPLRSAASLVALGAALLGHGLLPRDFQDLADTQALVERCHGRVGDWLREHAPRDAAVGVDNIGYIGWRSGLRIVDMRGVIQPGIAAAIAAGQYDFALRTLRPELIAMWMGRSTSWKYAPDDRWFRENGYRIVFEAPLLDARPNPAYTVFSRVETAR